MKTILVDNFKKTVFTIGKNQNRQFVLIISATRDLNLEVNLNGENAQAEVLGLIIGSKNSLINLHTIQHHLAPFTKSNLLIKSVSQDNAVFNFTGLIKIAKTAQKSQAYQRNDNILLSPMARVTSKPYLEILANDVFCTHGATMGEVDKDQLFYLQSRGLDKKAARSLIVDGFLHSLLDKISDLGIVKEVKSRLAELGYDPIL